MIDGRVISLEIALKLLSLDLPDDKSTLVQVIAPPSGNKPLPETMLTQINVAIWWYLATMC